MENVRAELVEDNLILSLWSRSAAFPVDSFDQHEQNAPDQSVQSFPVKPQSLTSNISPRIVLWAEVICKLLRAEIVWFTF